MRSWLIHLLPVLVVAALNSRNNVLENGDDHGRTGVSGLSHKNKLRHHRIRSQQPWLETSHEEEQRKVHTQLPSEDFGVILEEPVVVVGTDSEEEYDDINNSLQGIDTQGVYQSIFREDGDGGPKTNRVPKDTSPTPDPGTDTSEEPEDLASVLPPEPSAVEKDQNIPVPKVHDKKTGSHKKIGERTHTKYPITTQTNRKSPKLENKPSKKHTFSTKKHAKTKNSTIVTPLTTLRKTTLGLEEGSKKVPAFNEKRTILLLGDEIVHFLKGELLYGLCYIRTESYDGLTVADATERLHQLLTKGSVPDSFMIHVGLNDIVLESPNTPLIVSQRLKALWGLFRGADFPVRTNIVLSSILPRVDDITTFNANVAEIHEIMSSTAEKEGLPYIDHYSGFIKDGHIKDELFRFDGTLNENGMRQFEKVLFESCEEPKRDEDKGRKKASLELKDVLPLDRKNYDKHLPPKKDGLPTTVYFHVTVLSVDSINEESMTYVADIFLAQSWHDNRLRLPENMTEGYRILDVQWLKHIWRPDSFIKNAKKVTFHEMSVPNHYLWLYYDKTLLYMTKLTLEMSCAMKFEAYPHDTQHCSMMIESLSHTTDDLVFLWNLTDPLVVYPDIELPQLDIVDNSTEDCTLEYSTGNFTCLSVVFNLKRRLGYHLFHTYIPTTLIVVMSWISFWIRPEAIPARVTLGVTSLLTLATQNTQSQSSLPPVSYVKAIDIWMSSCSVFVFASLMEFALVNHFLGNITTTKIMLGYSQDENTRKEEIPTKRVNNGGMRQRLNSVVPGANVFDRQDQINKELNVAINIDKFSRFFFPLSFAILNVVYWTSYSSLL